MENGDKKAKSYTERLFDLEKRTEDLMQMYEKMHQAVNGLIMTVDNLVNQLRLLNDQMQSVYDLSELKIPLTRDNVANQVNKRRVERIQEILNKDEAAGIIQKKELVDNENDIIVYESDEVSLAFQAVFTFAPQGIKLNDLLGKKAGDVVQGIKIKQIYRIVENTPQDKT